MDSRKTRKRKPSSSPPPVKRRIKKVKDIALESESNSLTEQNIDSSNNSLRGMAFGITPASEKSKKGSRGAKNPAQSSYITSFFGKGTPAIVPERSHPASKVEVIESSVEIPQKELPKGIDWELEEGKANSDATEEIPELDENFLQNLNQVQLGESDKNAKLARSQTEKVPPNSSRIKNSALSSEAKENKPKPVSVEKKLPGPSATARQPVQPRKESKEEVKSSKDNMFSGKTVVFTGTMNSMHRAEAIDEVKALAG